MRTPLVKHLPLALSLVVAIGLSWESVLSLNGQSICPTSACKAVGVYLSIDSSLLVAGGALFFWLLGVLLFFADRYPARLQNAPLYFLSLALAIDASLMGFQVFSVRQRCLLCVSVAVLLGLIAIGQCITRKSFTTLTCFVLLWLGGFGAQAVMTMPPPQGSFADMAFFSTDMTGRQTAAPAGKAKNMTLIMSMNCPHCLEVITFLAQHYPMDAKINLVSIDADALSLAKLSIFIEKAPSSPNPFQLLKEIKGATSIPDVAIPTSLTKQVKNGSNYLNNIGIKSIPVLVADVSDGEKRILVGTTEIFAFLKP